jgi:hypothetical protein
MKTRFTTLLLVTLSLGAFAQDFKPFKVNTSIGFAKPIGPGSSGGILVSLEPKYGLNDQIDVGLRLEGALMGRSTQVSGQTSDTEIAYSGSYGLTGTYLLSVSNFRPYVGLGGGLYSTGGVSFSEGGSDIGLEAARKLGAMARVGFKYGHFNLGVEYNYVPSTTYTANLANNAAAIVKSNNSYVGFKLGFDIGGGYYE